eukprot:TRINITY_DN55582_c0_g1_i1.p1 TRINITY_DN55582_c0_g1~~TRINITY_DN55582_c0_g1_i1.p1  ORF type:complete len:686 (+),score=93.82 TRINITY_DN55582_c0_g1_i1:258-2315(+)
MTWGLRLCDILCVFGPLLGSASECTVENSLVIACCDRLLRGVSPGDVDGCDASPELRAACCPPTSMLWVKAYWRRQCGYVQRLATYASDRTCFGDMRPESCCGPFPMAGCFLEGFTREDCCVKELSGGTSLPRKRLRIALHDWTLRRKLLPTLEAQCSHLLPVPFLVVALDESVSATKSLLSDGLSVLAQLMQTVHLDWAALLGFDWSVFGILRRLQFRFRERTPEPNTYAGRLSRAFADEEDQVGLLPPLSDALRYLRDPESAVAARLHLALSADCDVSEADLTSGGALARNGHIGASQEVAPCVDLVVAAEKVIIANGPSEALQSLVTSPFPLAAMLHRLWQKLRKPTLAAAAARARRTPQAAFTLHGCRCKAQWVHDDVNCSAADFGCCDRAGGETPRCVTETGCDFVMDDCFPVRKPIGGSLSPSTLAPSVRHFLGDHVKLACDHFASIARQVLPPGGVVVDVGAGTAPCRAGLESAGLKYLAQDLKGYHVRRGGGQPSRSRFGHSRGSVFEKGYGIIDIVSNITNIPLPNASVDAVICTDVLEHVPEPIAAVIEIGRILRPGGLSFFQVPFGGALHNLPHHYQAGLTHTWFERVAALGAMRASWGYHFETLSRRIQRLFMAEVCIDAHFGQRAKKFLKQVLLEELPPILEQMRVCPSLPEAAADGAFPNAIRAVLQKESP